MNEPRATRYQRLRRRVHISSWLSAGLTMALVALTPIGGWLASVAQSALGDRDLPGPLQHFLPLIAFVALLVVIWEAAALPAALYMALKVDPAYRRTSASFREALGAHLQAATVALSSAIFAALVIALAVAVFGRWWWVAAGPAFSLALLAALRGGPALLARLGAVRPLPRPDLAARLAALARDARVPVTSIQEWVVDEDVRATAVVTGIGDGRRVLIASEVARSWSDDEIAVVVAHELGHHAHHDLREALVLDGMVLCAALWAADVFVGRAAVWLGISGPGDLAALPVMALVAGAVWVSATPLRHAQSRRQERRADLFALTATGRAEAFAAAVRRLGARQLVEDDPSTLTRWLFHRHPSVSERLALAETYRRVVTEG